jgi:stromal membrane-associated protein
MSRSTTDDRAQARLRTRLKALLKKPGNKTCAECNQKKPTWASLNLGCFFCMTCSGIHREMGVHISQVRSCSLDR